MLIAVRVIAQGLRVDRAVGARHHDVGIPRGPPHAGRRHVERRARRCASNRVAVGGPLIEATSWRVLFVIQVPAWRSPLPSHGSSSPQPTAARTTPSTWSAASCSRSASDRCWSRSTEVCRSGGPPLGHRRPHHLPRLRAGVPPVRATHRAPLVELGALRERNVFLPIVSQIFLNGPYMAGLVITSCCSPMCSTSAPPPFR